MILQKGLLTRTFGVLVPDLSTETIDVLIRSVCTSCCQQRLSSFIMKIVIQLWLHEKHTSDIFDNKTPHLSGLYVTRLRVSKDRSPSLIFPWFGRLRSTSFETIERLQESVREDPETST
nr:unnamed protein product [Callosobruchus analis]